MPMAQLHNTQRKLAWHDMTNEFTTSPEDFQLPLNLLLQQPICIYIDFHVDFRNLKIHTQTENTS